jgi:hypothetical protein
MVDADAWDIFYDGDATTENPEVGTTEETHKAGTSAVGNLLVGKEMVMKCIKGGFRDQADVKKY